MLAHTFKGPHQFKLASLPLAQGEELWLGVIGILVLVWLALLTQAPGTGSNAAPSCDAHGRAALICRQETVAPSAAPSNSICESFGRGGRVCFDRPG
jgi:hypothetical protein